MGKGTLVAITLPVFACAALLITRKSQNFKYNSYGLDSGPVAKALELANARKTQYVFYMLPGFMHDILRGRIQKLLDLVALVASAAGTRLIIQGKLHIVKHALFPEETRLHICYNREKPKSYLDIYYPRQMEKQKLLIFIHGGAWGSGNKFLYRLFGANLARSLKIPIAVVGYATYPLQSVQGQIDDVCSAVKFLYNYASNHKLAKYDIHLMGHSSGGHIITMATLQEPTIRCMLKSVIPVSGVFDLVAHYQYECARGVERISTLAPACGYTKESFRRHSPLYVLSASNEFKCSLPRFDVVHGDHDETVPFDSSVQFCNVFKASGNSCKLHLLQNVDHGSVILSLMHVDPRHLEDDSTQELPLISVLKEVLEL